MLEFAAPETVEVVSARNVFKTAAKSVKRQTLRKHLGFDSRKRTANRVIPTKSAKKHKSVAKRHFYQRFSLIMSSNFRYRLFVAVLKNLAGKVPVVDDVLSCHEQEFSPTTSLDEICIEFECQTDLNYYVDLRQRYLPLKLKFVKGRGYENYNNSNNNKEHKKEAKTNEETLTAEEMQESPVLLVNHLENILHSIFSKVEAYINNQQIYNSNGLYAHKSCLSINCKGQPLNTKQCCTAKCTTMNILMKLWKRLSFNFSSQGERKRSADPKASCSLINWGLIFSPFPNCYIQI